MDQVEGDGRYYLDVKSSAVTEEKLRLLDKDVHTCTHARIHTYVHTCIAGCIHMCTRLRVVYV